MHTPGGVTRRVVATHGVSGAYLANGLHTDWITEHLIPVN